MIKDTNYLTLQGWMITKLNLKGNSLLIYALIYGFCQDENSCFSGSLQYVQEWTNSSRQGVISTIKKLLSNKLIIKEEAYPYNKYYINHERLIELNCKQNLHDCKQSLQDSKQNLQNNINNNIEYNTLNNTNDETLENNYIKNKESQKSIDDIVSYLNEICNTKYKSTTLSTKKLILARMKEGYSIEDFKTVIDFKYKEWGVNPVKFSGNQLSSSYLRPTTLFGNKFESYLQAALLNTDNKVKSIEKLNDRSKLKF